MKRWALAAMAAAMLAAAAPAAAEGLSRSVAVDRPLVVQGGPEPLYVLITIKAPDRPRPDGERPPLNLSLVLDRSGSMEDRGKIEYLRRAAQQAVDRLARGDTLSIVEYDDQITVMTPAGPLEDPANVKQLIGALTSRGSTNLAGGLEEGIRQAQRFAGGDRLTRVLLLSDGLANQGLTDPRAIAQIARDARRAGVRVSALGLGVDYDEDLMQAIAEGGGGRYWYIENPNQMARIFEEELRTLLATSAKDVVIKFKARSGVKRASFVGFDDAGQPDATLSWDDFHAGEERTLLLRLEIDPAAEGSLDVGEVSIAYTDAETREAQSAADPVSVTVTADRAAADAAVNKAVLVESTLAETERAQSDAIRLYEAGDQAGAQQRLAAAQADLEAKNATLQDARIANKVQALSVEQAQAVAAAPASEAGEAFAKSAKLRAYQARSGNRQASMLQDGDKGLEVERLQQALKDAGLYAGDVDGVYDADVKAAVEAYQRTNGVAVDGVAGPATLSKLGLY